ncbi:MAG: phosphatase PAP2 family protein [Candidatus Latescibacteria bacterium]|nr:phosphatase PAP2 family protein [Candidatus Latescibacterota bacterium]
MSILVKLSVLLFFVCLWEGRVGASEMEALPLLVRDIQHLMARDNLAWMGLGLVAGGVAHQWDDDISGDISQNGTVTKIFDLGDRYGSSRNNILAATMAWGLARASRRPQWVAPTSEVLRALLLANAVVGPLKVGVRRRRPDGSNRFSFPSGHSANAFAVTAVLCRRYGLKVGVPLYAFTATVPLARIDARRHYLADVVAGAALGTVAGWAVHPSAELADRAWTLMPTYTRGGARLHGLLSF